MDYTETLIKQLGGYNGIIIRTHLDSVLLQNGCNSLREVVEHPGGVTIIPVDEDGYVYCVRQFRYPVAEHLLEVPAGKLEPDEAPIHCAMRELSEETGISADEYINLGEIYPSPGYCREILYIYMARGLHYGKSHPDENEFLDVEKVHIDELFDMVMENDIPDAKTVIAIMKAKVLLDKEK